jgi:PhnB protein
MQVIPYLNYKGDADEAIELYQKALDGEIKMIMLFKEFGDITKSYPEYADKIGHAEMKVGEGYIYFCDSLPGNERTSGTQIDVHINVDSMEALEKAFYTLKEGGSVDCELYDTTWGARYGAVTDRFGICWGFNYQYPQNK